MVKDVNDVFNFVVVGFGEDAGPQFVGNAQTDREAKALAEDQASKAHDMTFAVYQRMGSCRAETEVKWKGSAA